MSIQNVSHTAGHSIILDPASFTLAQAPHVFRRILMILCGFSRNRLSHL